MNYKDIGNHQRRTMNRVSRNSLATRFPFIIVILMAVVPALFLLIRCIASPDIAFVWNDLKGAWITYPTEVKTTAVMSSQARPLFFEKSFIVKDRKKNVVLHLKALRYFKLYVNQVNVPKGVPEGHHWKQETSIDITPYIREGENLLGVTVGNKMGPALLYAFVQGLEYPLATDESWKVSETGHSFRQAVIADDTRLNPETLKVITPFRCILGEKVLLISLFFLSVSLFLAGRLWIPDRYIPHIPLGTLIIVTVLWIFLFFLKIFPLSEAFGFDVPHHLYYIDYILQKGALPLATNGWLTYHPPLFYSASAAVVKVSEHVVAAENIFRTMLFIPFLCGIGNVWLVYFLSRKLFPSDPLKVFYAVAFAGLLPMNIYMSAYISNEPLNSFLIGCSILMMIGILSAPYNRLLSILTAGILFGLALLTKYTALLILPCVCLFLIYKLRRSEKALSKKTWVFTSLFLLCILTIAGWYYAVNVAHFGKPLVFNWELPKFTQRWWQQPGFHTPGYYLGFGEALRHPYFSGFHSFWDGLYSTFWGDGYVSGLAYFAQRPPMWNYRFMSIGFLLALPATLIMIVGFLRSFILTVKAENQNTRTVHAFLACLVLIFFYASLYYSLKAPMYSTVKAFFSLGLIGPLSVMAALGFETVQDIGTSTRWTLVFRAIFYGWWGTLMGVVLLSYMY